jgi:hypothetical protein
MFRQDINYHEVRGATSCNQRLRRRNIFSRRHKATKNLLQPIIDFIFVALCLREKYNLIEVKLMRTYECYGTLAPAVIAY